MCFFSTRHGRALVNQFWNQGAARCPHDGHLLESHLHPFVAGYLLVLACTHCRSKIQVTRYSDPERHGFRPWTTAEEAALADALGGGAMPVCPVCQTTLQSRAGRPSGAQALACLRCGNTMLLGQLTAVTLACVAL